MIEFEQKAKMLEARLKRAKEKRQGDEDEYANLVDDITEMVKKGDTTNAIESLEFLAEVLRKEISMEDFHGPDPV